MALDPRTAVFAIRASSPEACRPAVRRRRVADPRHLARLS
jgi:hypothetical protein